MPPSDVSLPEMIRRRLDESRGAAAELEHKLRHRLAALRSEADADPFRNPVLLLALELSRLIDHGEAPPEIMADLVQRLSATAFVDRAERLTGYLQDLSIAANEAGLAATLRRLADDPPKSFSGLRAKLERPCFGIVLTAHPTFSQPMELADALLAVATGCDNEGVTLDESAQQTLIDQVLRTEHLPPSPVTLALEHRWSMAALDRLQTALDRLTAVALDVAAELYPQRWTELVPCLATVASWVGYDLDGRSDITWTDTFAKRLEVKRAQFIRYRQRIAAIGATYDGVAPLLVSVEAALEAAEAAVGRQIEAIEQVAADPTMIGRLVTVFRATQDAGLVETDGLRAIVTKAIELTDALPAKRDLAVLRASLAWHGLGLAHTHVRLNATQLHNAIRKQVGMDTAPNDPAHRRSYMSAITELLGRVKTETVNFAALTAERTTAKRLFMIVQQLVRYIDAATPVRFLIAETEAGFTLLTALYFARQFGVESAVEISPLFETADAIERGDAILDEALRSPQYRAYIRRLGRLAVQFGFSDSGRYLGQMAATFQLERLRLRIAAVMQRHGLGDVQLILFNTHGESIGRGGHPGSLADRYRYISPPVTRAAFAAEGIALKEEVSFQGGDGFALFGSVPSCLSVLRVGLDHFLLPDSEADNDPVYEEGDYAVEFFAVIRQRFEALVDDPTYAALLGLFGSNLTPSTGSRPMKRQHEGALRAMDVAHVSQLRAIPNNTVLQQVALMANTIHGVGAARARDPELFDHLRLRSPRFRRAMAMVEAALAASDLDVFQAYIDCVDPGLWLTRSGRARSAVRRGELRRVATTLERLDLHPPLVKLFRRLQADFLLLTDRLSFGNSGLEAGDRETLLVLHVVRLVLIQRVYLLAVQIPEFSAHHGLSHEEALARLMRLDVISTVGLLKQIFPITEPVSLPLEALSEPASYRSDAAQSYGREHALLFEPLLALHRMIQKIGVAIGAEIGAVG